MAQRAYEITTDDAQFAMAYICRNMLLFKFQDEISPSKAAKQFQGIELAKATERAQMLNAWCEMLTSEEWHRLRLSIRKARERKAKRMRSISVSVKAQSQLSKIAKREGVTLSQALEKLCTAALRS